MIDVSSCLKKQDQIKVLFQECRTKDAIYEKIIELGKGLIQTILDYHKIDDNLVRGCQSLVYLHTECIENKLYFSLFSDALISRGLGALLLMAYNEEAPEVLLKCPPMFLDELNISHSLTPGRSNGFASMYLRMKQDATQFLIKKNI